MCLDRILEKYKKDLILITKGTKTFNRDKGIYEYSGDIETAFRGAILPLSEKDLKAISEGGYSIDDRKLYTNIDLESNSKIMDGDKIYSVYAVRNYDIVDPSFERYYMKRVDSIDG
jgi:hypothetical protein